MQNVSYRKTSFKKHQKSETITIFCPFHRKKAMIDKQVRGYRAQEKEKRSITIFYYCCPVKCVPLLMSLWFCGETKVTKKAENHDKDSA